MHDRVCYECIDLQPVDKNIKMRALKSSENIQKKEGGPDISVSDNQSSSVTVNELAMKALVVQHKVDLTISASGLIGKTCGNHGLVLSLEKSPPPLHWSRVG